MNENALVILLIAGLILYLGISGKLDAVWTAATSGGGTANPIGSQPSAPSQPSKGT